MNQLKEKFQKEPFEVLTVIINTGLFAMLIWFLWRLVSVLDPCK